MKIYHILAGTGEFTCGEFTGALSHTGFPALLLPRLYNFCSSRASRAPQRFIPGELRWYSSCCGLLRISPGV